MNLIIYLRKCTLKECTTYLCSRCVALWRHDAKGRCAQVRAGPHPGAAGGTARHPEEDVHKMDELVPAEGPHGGGRSVHRPRGRQKTAQTSGNHLRRKTGETKQWQDACPQSGECQQEFGLSAHQGKLQYRYQFLLDLVTFITWFFHHTTRVVVIV